MSKPHFLPMEKKGMSTECGGTHATAQQQRFNSKAFDGCVHSPQPFKSRYFKVKSVYWLLFRYIDALNSKFKSYCCPFQVHPSIFSYKKCIKSHLNRLHRNVAEHLPMNVPLHRCYSSWNMCAYTRCLLFGAACGRRKCVRRKHFYCTPTHNYRTKSNDWIEANSVQNKNISISTKVPSHSIYIQTVHFSFAHNSIIIFFQFYLQFLHKKSRRFSFIS